MFFSSIHYDLRESDLIALFSAFGPVVKCEMSLDPATGKSKGFCFLEFADQASVQAAMTMDGFELAGRKVSINNSLILK
jgi:RNA recognition motif-containing protein